MKKQKILIVTQDQDEYNKAFNALSQYFSLEMVNDISNAYNLAKEENAEIILIDYYLRDSSKINKINAKLFLLNNESDIKNELKNNIKKYSKDITDFYDQKSAFINNIIEKSHTKHDRIYQLLEKTFKEIDNEKIEINNKVNEITKDIKLLKKQKQDTLTKIENSILSKSNTEKEINSLVNDNQAFDNLKAANEKKEKIDQIVSELSSKSQLKENELNVLKNEIAKQSEKLNQQISKLQTEINEKTNNISKLKAFIHDINKRIKEASNARDEVYQNVNNLLSKKQILNDNLLEIQNKLNTEEDDLKAQIQDLHEKINSVKLKIEKDINEKETTNLESIKIQNDINELDSKNKTVKIESEKLENDLKKAKVKSEPMIKEINSYNEKLNDANEILNNARDEKREIQQKLEQFEERWNQYIQQG